jgi:hypothetical protein
MIGIASFMQAKSYSHLHERLLLFFYLLDLRINIIAHSWFPIED